MLVLDYPTAAERHDAFIDANRRLGRLASPPLVAKLLDDKYDTPYTSYTWEALYEEWTESGNATPSDYARAAPSQPRLSSALKTRLIQRMMDEFPVADGDILAERLQDRYRCMGKGEWKRLVRELETGPQGGSRKGKKIPPSTVARTAARPAPSDVSRSSSKVSSIDTKQKARQRQSRPVDPIDHPSESNMPFVKRPRLGNNTTPPSTDAVPIVVSPAKFSHLPAGGSDNTASTSKKDKIGIYTVQELRTKFEYQQERMALQKTDLKVLLDPLARRCPGTDEDFWLGHWDDFVLREGAFAE